MVEREPVGQIGIGEVITRNRQIVGSDVGDGGMRGTPYCA
jgi:hypothetical protein